MLARKGALVSYWTKEVGGLASRQGRQEACGCGRARILDRMHGLGTRPGAGLLLGGLLAPLDDHSRVDQYVDPL
jgi:hypothetical protein